MFTLNLSPQPFFLSQWNSLVSFQQELETTKSLVCVPVSILIRLYNQISLVFPLLKTHPRWSTIKMAINHVISFLFKNIHQMHLCILLMHIIYPICVCILIFFSIASLIYIHGCSH